MFLDTTSLVAAVTIGALIMDSMVLAFLGINYAADVFFPCAKREMGILTIHLLFSSSQLS